MLGWGEATIDTCGVRVGKNIEGVAAAGALGLFAGRVSGFLGPYYGAAANDLNRIFRVDDAGWRHAPQFNA